MSRIRVALVTNSLGPPIRGNGTTVHRWLGWLSDVDVDVMPLGSGFELPPGRSIEVVHGYHAIHGGRHARTLAALHDLPLVVSLGGTDLYALKVDAPRADEVRAVLSAASVITGAFESFGGSLAALLDDAPPYAVVPRGVAIPDAPPPTPDPETVRVLLPAGIRRVKDVIGAVRLAEALRAAGVPLTLCIAGPVLDGEYARSFEATLASMGHPDFIRWRRAVPRTGMPALYDHADVVWNTSLHEGGPNALLEGLAYGCAVMARDVDGVRDFLDAPDAPGHLVSWDAALPDIDALAAWHDAVRQESVEERAARTETARAWLRTNHDSHAEVEALRAAYELALGR